MSRLSGMIRMGCQESVEWNTGMEWWNAGMVE